MIRRDPILSRPHRRLLVVALTMALLTALLAGCGSSDDEAQLEIIGTYTDEFGQLQVITATTWDSSGSGFTLIFHILDYDNLFNYLVAQNDASNSFNAGKYSRFAWTNANGNLYYCQDVYDAATSETARSAPFPNSSDLASGCGGFSWTNLTP
jgi:hypothetical protein